MDLSPQEKAEEIQRWISAGADHTYLTLSREYINQRDAAGLDLQYLSSVLVYPEAHPQHFEIVLRAFATLKLIGE